MAERSQNGAVSLGATVMGFDPYVPDELLQEWNVQRADMDTLADNSDIVFVAVPPTPSAKHLLNRERIYRLRKGGLVVVITRAFAVDMDALRERLVKDELAGAFDVYDIEPVPVDDELTQSGQRCSHTTYRWQNDRCQFTRSRYDNRRFCAGPKR